MTLICCMRLSYVHPLFRENFFWKSEGANQPNHPTSQNSLKWDKFFKNCPIWLKFGMQVSFSPQYCPEKFR